MVKKNPINIFIHTCCILLLFGCAKNAQPKYSFIVAGHAYGSLDVKTLGLHPPFMQEVQKINKDKSILLGFFTGDLVHFPETPYWEAALEDINKLKCETHIAPGNHEVYHKNLFEKYLNRYYYAFEKNNDLFIILDGNENNWNIEGKQLDFLTKTLNDKAIVAEHVFIFIHQLIWWQDNKEYGACQPNSFMAKADTLNFRHEILPLLQAIEKPVYLFAGDVGAYKGRCSVFHHQINKVTLLASGMGNLETDNYLKVDVLENGQVKINIVGLNCKTGNDCLGKIENY